MTDNNEIIVRNIQEGLKQCSIEINRNSKGVTFSVKAYGDTSTPEGKKELIDRIDTIVADLNKKYGQIEE